jgi:peptide/nickel transport system permease protein
MSTTRAATSVTSTDLASVERKYRSRSAIAFSKFRRRPGAMIGAAIIVFFIVLAVFAPAIAPFDPDAISRDRRAAPSMEHWFGTDELGRDVLSRVIFGAQVSLRVGLIAVSIAVVVGSLLGLVAAYAGGWLDSLIMRIMDVMLAFPGILLAIAIVAVLGPSLTNAMIAIGIEAIPIYTRTARASTLSVKELEYVTGARAAGATNGTIVLRHILPNITSPIIVLATIGVAGAILTASGLSYLGLGAQPPTAEWGAMLSSARSYLRESWWMATFPGLAIMMVVLSLNLFGDGLRDILDPRTKH